MPGSNWPYTTSEFCDESCAKRPIPLSKRARMLAGRTIRFRNARLWIITHLSGCGRLGRYDYLQSWYLRKVAPIKRRYRTSVLQSCCGHNQIVISDHLAGLFHLSPAALAGSLQIRPPEPEVLRR